MSITAEKIMVALQNVNERNGGAPYEAINKWQREVLSEQAEAILSLLQQGEPEGWRRIADEALRKYAKSLRVSEAKRPGSTYGMLKPEAVEEAADCLKNSFLSASPLPPAPGAETGAQKQDRFDADAEAHRIASLPIEDRVFEIIELLKASSSRQAALEEAGTVLADAAGEIHPTAPSSSAIDRLHAAIDAWFVAINAATPPAEGKTK